MVHLTMSKNWTLSIHNTCPETQYRIVFQYFSRLEDIQFRAAKIVTAAFHWHTLYIRDAKTKKSAGGRVSPFVLYLSNLAKL